MQYDLPQVPDATFTTEGKNMAALLRLIGADPESFHISFAPANTGRNARKRPDGNYYPDTSDPDSRNFADPVNFGVHPGQYSSALASRYPIIRQTVISDLPWAQFNSSIDLSPFRTKEGHPLPARIQLFDKNFTHLVVEMAGRPVHVVFFHAVPPFHFGNQHTPNYQRNRDQLRFLEWYLTGETDIPIHLPQLKPHCGGTPDRHGGLECRSQGSFQTGNGGLESNLRQTPQCHGLTSPHLPQARVEHRPYRLFRSLYLAGFESSKPGRGHR